MSSAVAVRGPPGKGPKAFPPNRTLYLNGLPSSKIRKEDQRRNLYMLFATYGIVLDVNVMKTPKMRGQGHVVFRDIESSTQAMRALQGFRYFGREINIAYAKGKSDKLAKLDGTYKLPVKEGEVETTDLQKEIFGDGPAPAKAVPTKAAEDAAKGTKRGREEVEEEEDEESDGGSAMDVSDSD
ncbi:hypothetical protein BCR34DRAFT_624881 [Clohesyomyces aquaticus]|uniref:RRM domain-containing protein n=1 Tax=Clohesyomyces aquaticus TaxID=1231657 RepID=A0A1Y1ZLS1_9PLEO|nr:hypothetical protein BCR34DRAFT_624881 [Clohesyomyces aquaticus]